jgi:hypothetical protein
VTPRRSSAEHLGLDARTVILGVEENGPMPPERATRARHLRSLLDHVERLPEPAQRAIRDGLGPQALEQITSSATSDWLPFALDLDLTHAIAGALGVAGTHRFFHEHQLVSFRGPLFKALVDSATTLFGLDPGSWARWIPRGWGIVFRECGRWEIDRSAPGEVDLALVGPPPGSLDDEVWLLSVASSFSAFLTVAKTTGEFALDRVDFPRDAACYRLRWPTA